MNVEVDFGGVSIQAEVEGTCAPWGEVQDAYRVEIGMVVTTSETVLIVTVLQEVVGCPSIVDSVVYVVHDAQSDGSIAIAFALTREGLCLRRMVGSRSIPSLWTSSPFPTPAAGFCRDTTRSRRRSCSRYRCGVCCACVGHCGGRQHSRDRLNSSHFHDRGAYRSCRITHILCIHLAWAERSKGKSSSFSDRRGVRIDH